MPKRPPNSVHRSSSAGADQAERQAALARVLLALLDAYRVLLAPLLPRACRFAPSCSTYAREAVARHGTLRGVGLAIGRLVRCQPWHPGGYDPVPPPRA